jgi:hypothetical protein
MMSDSKVDPLGGESNARRDFGSGGSSSNPYHKIVEKVSACIGEIERLSEKSPACGF